VTQAIPVPLLEHFRSRGTSLALLWRVVRVDGLIFTLTNHDADIPFLGERYRTTSAFDASAVVSKADLSVDNLEVIGILNAAGIEREDIEAGRWDYARVQLSRVNWRRPQDGAQRVRSGTLGKVQHRSGQFVVELRGLMQALQTQIGEIVTPDCQANFGDSRCLYPIETLREAATIVSVSSRRAFTIDALGPGLWPGGDLTFEAGSGLNQGFVIELRDVAIDSDGALVELQLPAPYLPTVGDPVSLVPGCPRTKAACIAYDNLLHFRGFSFVPGPDSALSIGGQ
jgi:uncharacterized phage protein (TIGR02218 family)